MTEQVNNSENLDERKQEFVREQIKEKPMNYRKLQKNLLESVLCGIAFALSACLVFALYMILFPRGDQSSDVDLIVVDDSETEIIETESEEPETESETEEEKTADEDEAVPADNIIIEKLTLTLDDYQELQNEMYAIGNVGNHSVVAISSVVSSTDWFNNTYETEDISAGLIVAETEDKILILTEVTSVPNPEQIYVTFYDDTTVQASVHAKDSNTGLMVIETAKGDLSEVTQSTISVAAVSGSGYIRNGQLVIALGSPLGTPFSILTGTITSKNNEISRLDNNFSVYTTDMPGNKESSGILLDVKGEVIGLIRQEYNMTETSGNLTAVSINEVQQVIEMLIDGKNIPYAGLYLSRVTEKIANTYSLPTGLYIREVAMDSPAMEAGLQSGDIITSLNGAPTTTVENFYLQLLQTKEGESLTITVQRQNSEDYHEITCTVTPGVLN